MFEIDQKIIDETTHCQHSFQCLSGDFSQCGGIEKKGEDFLCKSSHSSGFCYYRIELGKTRIICGCYTRREIYRKYGK
jgi:hypothetical protein